MTKGEGWNEARELLKKEEEEREEEEKNPGEHRGEEKRRSRRERSSAGLDGPRLGGCWTTEEETARMADGLLHMPISM